LVQRAIVEFLWRRRVGFGSLPRSECVRIRQIPSLAAVVLAALSGYSQEEDTRRSREAGFNHHLVKPADMDVLRRLIAEAVPSAADVAT